VTVNGAAAAQTRINTLLANRFSAITYICLLAAQRLALCRRILPASTCSYAAAAFHSLMVATFR
jgi:hypothetical protein